MLITGAFAKILEAERNTFNYKFAEARHARPALDPTAFSEHLRAVVAPIVEALDRQHPDKTSEAVHVLYDLSLDLLGQGFLGLNSRYPFVAQGWQSLLPRLAHHIAAAPRYAIGAITNALYNLSVTSGARPQEWIESTTQLASVAPDLDSLLRAGQIAAWRAGMAHYRRGALELCKTLDPAVARVALGLLPNNSLSLETIVARLSADPWLAPQAIRERPGNRRLKLVARAGAFRGLGGLFLSTPTVAAAGEHFVVRDGESKWLLVADVLGATWHRADDSAVASSQTLPFSIAHNGHVTREGSSWTFPELAKWNSAAATGTTLAVTTPLSFAVHLIALVET